MELLSRVYRLFSLLLGLAVVFGLVVPLVFKLASPFGTEVFDAAKPYLDVLDKVLVGFVVIAVVATFTASRRS